MPPDYYLLKALGVLPTSVGAYNPFPSYSAHSSIPSFSTQSLPGSHILDHQPFIIQHPFPQSAFSSPPPQVCLQPSTSDSDLTPAHSTFHPHKALPPLPHKSP